MPNSEIKILRDELAKAIAENKQQKNTIAELLEREAHLEDQLREATLIIQKQAARLKYYENPNSPSSAGSIPTKQKKAKQRKDPSEYKKPGRKPGQPGTSHHRKSSKKVYHMQEQCDCGCRDIGRIDDTEVRQVTEIQKAPAETVTHIASTGTCSVCGKILEAPDLEDLGLVVPGTSLGPGMVSEIVQLWMYKMTPSDIAQKLTDSYGVYISEASVKTTLVAAGKKLKGEMQNITESLSESSLLKADETPYPFGNRTGYVWTVIGDDAVRIHATPSRGAPVIDEIAPHYHIPITVDGYSVYNIFETRQRCYAHILRQSKDLAEKDDSLRVPHEDLKEQFRRACSIQRGPGDPVIDTGPLVSDILAVAGQYNRGGKDAKAFAVTLENAAPDMLTFVNHPGMEPTNNESERMLRPVVISRKIRQRLVSTEGAMTFSVLMTCMMTWKKRGLNVSEMLYGALCGT